MTKSTMEFSATKVVVWATNLRDDGWSRWRVLVLTSDSQSATDVSVTPYVEMKVFRLRIDIGGHRYVAKFKTRDQQHYSSIDLTVSLSTGLRQVGHEQCQDGGCCLCGRAGGGLLLLLMWLNNNKPHIWEWLLHPMDGLLLFWPHYLFPSTIGYFRDCM